MEFRIIFSLHYSISINTFEVEPPPPRSDSLHNAVVKPKNTGPHVQDVITGMHVFLYIRLEGKIRELEDLQSSKLEKWKTSSQPLHEWLDGIDDDAKEFDAIGGNIVDVHAQFDELQVSTGVT